MPRRTARPQSVATARRRFCAHCGVTVRSGVSACPACGHANMTTRWIQPRKESPQTAVVPPFPWERLLWPEGVTMAVSARFGVGKSASAAMLGLPGPNGDPPLLKNWITAEQDPAPVRAMFKRLGVPCPWIYSADPLDPLGSVKRALRTQVTGAGAVTVLDSTTPLGIDGAVEVMNFCVQDGLATGRRYWLISQQNKQREIFGKVALAFVPDVVIDIEVDDFGRRRVVVTKNRHGDTSITYFAFDGKGRIVKPDFQQVVHSVEGATTDMQLVPFGLRVTGMRWDGLLKALDAENLLPGLAGYASAALATNATRAGFLAPPDVESRRRLAETHGMKWLSIPEGVALLANARSSSS
jgi:hypothetical protein